MISRDDNSKRTTLGRFVFRFFVIAIGVLGFLAAEYGIYVFGGVVGVAVVGGTLLVLFVLPWIAKTALNALSSAAAESAAARENEKSFSVPKGFLYKNFTLAFCPFWLIPSAFLLLPGGIGLFPAIPGTAIACVRIEKTYPLFEELGFPKGKYKALHFLAYVLAFSLFTALKIVLSL